jgi:HPt (histidine-containing phosphotransfer) domain-containing protein
VATDDLSAASRAAHTLKGGCGYVGAVRLAELCAAVELAAEFGDAKAAAAGVAAIEAELATLTEALRRLSGSPM